MQSLPTYDLNAITSSVRFKRIETPCQDRRKRTICKSDMKKYTITFKALERVLSATGDHELAETSLAAFQEIAPGEHFSAILVHLRDLQVEDYLLNRRWQAPDTSFWKPAREGLIRHPLAREFMSRRRPTVLLRSRLIADAVWKKTWIYNEVEHPLGVEDIASICMITGSNRLLVLTSGRSRRFSDRDLEPIHGFHRVLQALSPFARVTTRVDLPPGAPTRTVDNPVSLLTSREMEILYWVREGKRDAEIGTILNISPRTVSHHVESILRKLGAETRTAAALFFESNRARTI